jgi:hypothetical protein
VQALHGGIGVAVVGVLAEDGADKSVERVAPQPPRSLAVRLLKAADNGQR